MSETLDIRLIKSFKKAIEDFHMISPRDRILLSFSGGKDSFCLFKLLHDTLYADNPFIPLVKIYPVYIDLGFQSGTSQDSICRADAYISQSGSDLHIERTEISRIALDPENKKNPCFICSRMRRKKIYEIASMLDCSKIAIAHHRDDIIETLLLNIFFAREISTMVPRQNTFGERFQIIRPLAYIEERLIQQYTWKHAFPVAENPCPEKALSKRRFIKDLITQIEEKEPNIRHNIFHATKHVKPDFLMGRDL